MTDKTITSKACNSLAQETSCKQDISTHSVIIDGVNVSGCKYFTSSSNFGGNYCNAYCDCCKNNSNCYYKQLARKTEECEKLFECLKQANGRRYKYKQALEEIKGMLETIIETNKIMPLQNNLMKILQKCEVLND